VTVIRIAGSEILRGAVKRPRAIKPNCGMLCALEGLKVGLAQPVPFSEKKRRLELFSESEEGWP
jgi:hypothetical protein